MARQRLTFPVTFQFYRLTISHAMLRAHGRRDQITQATDMNAHAVAVMLVTFSALLIRCRTLRSRTSFRKRELERAAHPTTFHTVDRRVMRCQEPQPTPFIAVHRHVPRHDDVLRLVKRVTKTLCCQRRLLQLSIHRMRKGTARPSSQLSPSIAAQPPHRARVPGSGLTPHARGPQQALWS